VFFFSNTFCTGSFRNAVRDVKDLVFVDESHFDWTDVVPRYGYAPLGQQVIASYPTTKKCSISIIGVYSWKGMIDVGFYTGGVNGDRFLLFVQTHLVPHLTSCSIVVMDNIRFHYSKAVEQAIAAVGGRIMFTPPYSPEFNPIEQSFGHIERHLVNTLQHSLSSSQRTEDNLIQCLACAISYTNRNTNHLQQIRNCGYKNSDELTFYPLSQKMQSIIRDRTPHLVLL
jgi:transposase